MGVITSAFCANLELEESSSFIFPTTNLKGSVGMEAEVRKNRLRKSYSFTIYDSFVCSLDIWIFTIVN